MRTTFNLAFLFLLCFGFQAVSGQTSDQPNGLLVLVDAAFSKGNEVFTYQPYAISEASPSAITNSVVADSRVLEATPDLDRLLVERPGALRLTLPIDGSTGITLMLTSSLSPFSADYQPQSGTGTRGLYYKGIVAGEPSSLAAISFFETGDEPVIGVVSFNGSSYVIGSHVGKTILYNDADILVDNWAACSTKAPEGDFLPAGPIPESSTCKQTKVQFDCDYRMYTDRGSSVPNVENYVSGFFNVVQALFTVDNFEVVISEIFVYTSTDPYAGISTSPGYLSSFRAEKVASGINGDLAHLLSTRPLGLGGIAYLGGNLCVGNNRVCFSNISNGYASFPFYSWTIDVTSHEMGHVMGSPHTHNCGWTGGALDNCFSTEGSCPPGPTPPSTGGTIMSYCHLTALGKDFSLGFADQPAALIRYYQNLSSCLDPCSWTPPVGQCADYCPSAGSGGTEWIESIQVGPLSNTSGDNGGYLDDGLSSAEFTVGDTYGLALTPGFSGSSSVEHFRVWMDFNRNGDFSEINELVFDQASTGGSTLTGSFTIPGIVDTGRIGLRIQMKRNSSSDACETFTFGEVEDYCVQLSYHPCPIPSAQNVTIASPTSATISWSAEPVGGYEVRGRKAGGAWQYFIVISPFKSYGGFKAGKTYEWQVRSLCADTLSPFGPVHTFTMPVSREISSPLQLYPNPATEQVTVVSGTESSFLQLFDLQGNLVTEVEMTSQAFQLDTRNLAPGIYNLQLIGSQGNRQSSLLVVK